MGIRARNGQSWLWLEGNSHLVHVCKSGLHNEICGLVDRGNKFILPVILTLNQPFGFS